MAIKKKLNIIIFGASGSIGDYLFNQFYEEGHNLLLYIRNKKKINFFKRKFKNHKGFQTIKFEQLDITKSNDLKKKILHHKNFIKKTDIIVNACGDQGEIGNFFQLNLKNFYKTFEINFFSQIIFFRTIYSSIKNNKKLLILLFSGGGVTNSRKNFSSYVLSKVALVKLVEILSEEFKNKNIRINAISPGIIDSQMTRAILKQNKKNVDTKEINKIKKEIVKSNKSLYKIVKLIKFLNSKKGQNISGKIISSRWDNYTKWSMKKIKKISNSDIFNLRRIQKI